MLWLYNHKMRHQTACKIQLVSRFWNEMILYHISELMLPYDRKSFNFDPVQKRETNWNFTGFQMPYFMIILTLYFSLLNVSWIKKMSTFVEYGAFKTGACSIQVNLNGFARFGNWSHACLIQVACLIEVATMTGFTVLRSIVWPRLVLCWNFTKACSEKLRRSIWW